MERPASIVPASWPRDRRQRPAIWTDGIHIVVTEVDRRVSRQVFERNGVDRPDEGAVFQLRRLSRLRRNRFRCPAGRRRCAGGRNQRQHDGDEGREVTARDGVARGHADLYTAACDRRFPGAALQR